MFAAAWNEMHAAGSIAQCVITVLPLERLTLFVTGYDSIPIQREAWFCVFCARIQYYNRVR